MQYTFENINIRGFCLTVVYFFGKGKERRAARRMNRFYEALAKTAYTYAEQCLRDDPHSCYLCHMEVTPENDRIHVTVILSHKRPGVVSCRKKVRYLWQDGVLLAENIG